MRGAALVQARRLREADLVRRTREAEREAAAARSLARRARLVTLLAIGGSCALDLAILAVLR